MNKTQVINLGQTPEKWLKLMLHLQNAIPGVFQLIFPDVEAARKATHRMTNAVDRHSEWFHLIICQRGCGVYVIKTQYIQQVVLKDEQG